MKCPKCQFDNRQGVKFFEGCGSKMEMVCPSVLVQLQLSPNIGRVSVYNYTFEACSRFYRVTARRFAACL